MGNEMSAEAIRVLIVDDHAIVREGLRTLLSEEPGLRVVGEATDGAGAVAAAADLHPDVVLMDLVMPEVDGIEATRRLREAGAPCRVIVLTSFADDRKVRDALQAGAIGYLLKDVLRPDLVQAIRAAAQGLPALRWWRSSPSGSTRCCASSRGGTTTGRSPASST
jgi:two-component system, NarL family, response regulator LiaR